MLLRVISREFEELESLNIHRMQGMHTKIHVYIQANIRPSRTNQTYIRQLAHYHLRCSIFVKT